MSDQVKIRLYVNTGFAGCKHEDVMEVDREDWDAMTDKQKEESLDEFANDFMANYIDFGAFVIEDE